MKFYLVGARLVAQRLVGVRQLLLHHHDDDDGDDNVDNGDNADGDDNVDDDDNVDGDDNVDVDDIVDGNDSVDGDDNVGAKYLMVMAIVMVMVMANVLRKPTCSTILLFLSACSSRVLAYLLKYKKKIKKMSKY